jgi:hypothetical protein
MFVLQLLESMKIKVKLPVTVQVDNVGAIFMSKNTSTSNRTKHVWKMELSKLSSFNQTTMILTL